ncbi:MAG: acyltransferase [Leptospira sp.]|nr:acyltransferase [Leptospira sp.]
MLIVILDEFRIYFEIFLQCLPGKSGYLFRRIFTTFIFSEISKNVSIGRNVQIEKGSSIKIGSKCTLGDNCYLNSVGGRIEIEDDVSFNRNVHINASVGGKIKINKYCLIGPNVVFRTANHVFESTRIPIRNQGHNFFDITLFEDVWLGANVVILPGVEIGKGSIIAAGSVVTKNIPEFSIAGGVPAIVLKKRKK